MTHRFLIAAAVALTALGATAQAQLTLPPSGGNERATVIQHIGLVKVSIDYSSPHVHSPQGQDRRGKIWGTLVPWGLANLGFGTCKECPWRVGANVNTIFTTSHDIQVNGSTLPAGSYALFAIPQQDEWTLIFSKNYTSWGSFFYDPAEDALRVKAKPEKSEYREVLTFDFTERRDDHATVAMKWEELSVPIDIAVPNAADLYVANLRNQLRNSEGFTDASWQQAARYALDNKHPVDGLLWAEAANNSTGGIGRKNFTNLMTLADAYEANGKAAEAAKARDAAMNDPSATPFDLHGYARQLVTKGKKEEALKVWELSAKRFGTVWPVNIGLARGYSAVGRYPEALKYAKLALAQAPDEQNKKNIEGMVKKLEAGQDIN
jgi:tetratricopeptide (TPR) repeat protein